MSQQGPRFAARPLRIYFSYDYHKQYPFLALLQSDLEKRGHTVLLSAPPFGSSSSWHREIAGTLRHCQLILAFLSCSSASYFGGYRTELEIAFAENPGAVRTVLIDDEESIAVPAPLTFIQWLDMHDWEKYYRKGGSGWKIWYAKQSEELISAIERNGTMFLSGDLSEIKERLGLFDDDLTSPRESSLLQSPFVGRAGILNEIERWRRDLPSYRVCAVCGEAGMGKSRLAAHIRFHHPQAAAGIYCSHDTDRYHHASDIIRLLSFTLAARMPDYRHLLLMVLRRPGGVSRLLPASELSEDILIRPLLRLNNSNRERVFVVVDGFDETGPSGNTVLAGAIRHLIDKAPPYLCFLITCRDHSVVSDCFNEFKIHFVSLDSADNLTDIRTYFASVLHPLLPYYSHDKQDHILTSLVTRSGGCFMYAHLFCSEFLEMYPNFRQSILCPPALTHFYGTVFQRRFPDPASFESVALILSLLIVSGPMPRVVIHDIFATLLGWDESYVDALLRSLDSFVSIAGKNNEVFLSHATLADWLPGPEAAAGGYGISLKKGADILVTYAVLRIGRNKTMGMPLETGEEKVGRFGDRLRYDLSMYYIAAGRYGELDVLVSSSATPVYPYLCRAVCLIPRYYDTVRKRVCESVAVPDAAFAEDIHAAGCWCLNHGMLDEAEYMFTSEIRIYSALVSSGHILYQFNLAVCLYYSGGRLRNLKKDDAAIDCYLRSLSVFRRIPCDGFSEVDEYVARLLFFLGDLYAGLGRFCEAEEVYVDGLDVLRRNSQAYPGACDAGTALILCRLGDLYAARNRISGSARSYLSALSILRRLSVECPGMYGSETTGVLHSLESLYRRAGRV